MARIIACPSCSYRLIEEERARESLSRENVALHAQLDAMDSEIGRLEKERDEARAQAAAMREVLVNEVRPFYEAGGYCEIELIDAAIYSGAGAALLERLATAEARHHWPDCVLHHGGTVCDMGPECGRDHRLLNACRSLHRAWRRERDSANHSTAMAYKRRMKEAEADAEEQSERADAWLEQFYRERNRSIDRDNAMSAERDSLRAERDALSARLSSTDSNGFTLEQRAHDDAKQSASLRARVAALEGALDAVTSYASHDGDCAVRFRMDCDCGMVAAIEAARPLLPTEQKILEKTRALLSAPAQRGESDQCAKEPTYPCRKCGKPRTKDEGGTTFTVCDECWDAPAPASEGEE